MLFKSPWGAAKAEADCEAACVSTPGCRYFSHRASLGLCVFCSSCTPSALGTAEGYTSWRRRGHTTAQGPLHTLTDAAEPLLLTVMDQQRPAVLRVANNDSSEGRLRPAWVTPLNLADASLRKLGNTRNKPRLVARWLRAHAAELPERRIVAFVDGTDVFYGGCSDFALRFEELERRSGASVVFAAELGCSHLPPDLGNCTTYPPPPTWAQGDDAGLVASAACARGDNGGFGPCLEPPSNRFLNSGGVAGRAGALRELFEAVARMPDGALRNAQGHVQDQSGFVRWYLRDGAARGTLSRNVALDHGGSLFVTLPRLRSGAVRRDGATGALLAEWRRWDAARPLCFVHAAGNKHESFVRRSRGHDYRYLPGLYPSSRQASRVRDVPAWVDPMFA